MIIYQAICDSSNLKPLTVKETFEGENGEKWKQAMQDELKSLHKASA